MSEEKWDILDANGQLTGRTIKRGQRFKKGNYHLSVHIYVVNSKKEFLIQKRSMKKEKLPGIWDMTGGAVLAGEDSLTGAIRELEEEVGIALKPENFLLIKRLKRKTSFVDLWLAFSDANLSQIVMQEDEVDAVKFVSAADMIQITDEMDYRDDDYKQVTARFICENIKDSRVFENLWNEYSATTQEIKQLNLSETAKQIVDLQKISYAIEAQLIDFADLPPLKDTVEMIESSEETFYGYFLDNELVGAIAYEENAKTVIICRLMVHPEYFHQGIASTLIRYVLNKKLGKSFCVTTGAENEPAKRLYIKHGFMEKEQFKVGEGLLISRLERRGTFLI